MSRDLLRPISDWLAGPTAESLGWALTHFLWQGSAAALLLAGLLFLLRRSAPGPRYLVACATLFVMAVCPAATLAWMSFDDSGPPPTAILARTIERSEPTAPPIGPAKSISVTPASLVSSVAPEQPEPSTSEAQPPIVARDTGGLRRLFPWFVAVWLCGVTALSVRLGAGWLRVQRLRRRHTRPAAADWEDRLRHVAAAIRVSRPVRLLESAVVEVPAVVGWLRPVILLPAAGLAGLSARQLEALLAHELAHIRRHDYFVNLLQSAAETLLFYHPAIWWVSRVIRAEREACCDEVAAEACGGRLEFARTLAALEESRVPPRLLVAAKAGPLVERVRRLTGLPPSYAGGPAALPAALLTAGVLALLAFGGPRNLQADGPDAGASKPPAAADDWGPESGGLRCRLVAMPADANDEAPDLMKTAKTFAGGDAVTFAVELKNVSDKPVTLLGVRYGESYPTAAGKLAAEFFAPHLSAFEFTDPGGKPVPRPERSYVGGMLELSGASAHDLKPGESLRVLLRPAKFSSPMSYELPPGEYAARVRYRGPSEETIAGFKKHWPDKPQAKAWSGEVASNRVAFTVAEDPAAPKPPELAWGAAQDGLQAAAELRPRDRAPWDLPGTVPLDTPLDVTFHLKNVSDRPVSLVSETWRQEDRAEVTDEAGKTQDLTGTWYSGWPIMVRWTLRPGEIAELHAAGIGVAESKEAAEKFEHPVGKILVAKPGRYTLRHTIRIGSIQSRNEKGELVIPGKGDWQGELVAGAAPLVVRPRTPEDDARARAGQFLGRIELVAKGGGRVEGGTLKARAAGGRDDLATRASGGLIEIPDCPPKPLTISARVPGYEEALFYDVRLSPGETKALDLTPAAPTRLRLVTADGKPVVGAKVRFFNKTADNAGGGPYPVDGLNGPVWTTSSADGSVVLGSLQKVDPFYKDLGDAVYFFYVEPPDSSLTGRFLGAVKAGADLGDVAMSPPLEVRGEVRGTKGELDQFDAEWDQPFEMRTANPAAAAPYAVSQPLETRREGDKLTFRLSGLRPGKLRFVANFGPRPHSVSHTYGRRDPKDGDVVVEVDLTGPVSDLAITPSGRAAPAGGGAK